MVKILNLLHCVATALTVHGIETFITASAVFAGVKPVATALTVHGIETLH